MLSHPVPTRPLREMGAERVLAVHLKGQWSKTAAPRHHFDVIGQSFAIAQEMTSSVWRSAADVVIEPDVADFDDDDFTRADELIRVGELAMRRALPEVRKWLDVPVEATAPAKTPALFAKPAPMSALTVAHLANANCEMMRGRLRPEQGERDHSARVFAMVIACSAALEQETTVQNGVLHSHQQLCPETGLSACTSHSLLPPCARGSEIRTGTTHAPSPPAL